MSWMRAFLGILCIYRHIHVCTPPTIKVVSSSVGPVHALPVRLELEVLVALMTDEVNRRVLAQGIALPAVPFIEFVKPELQLLSGALAVLTDLAYRSTAVLPL